MGILALTFLFVVTACGAEQDTAASAPSDQDTPATSEESGAAEATTTQADASFEIGGNSYEFSPTTCIVGEEDIVVQGAGNEVQSGELAFLDVDLTSYEESYAGGADIELGTDQPFTSSEDLYRLDTLFDDTNFALSIAGTSFTVEGTFYADGAAQLPEGNTAQGVLQVRCGG